MLNNLASRLMAACCGMLTPPSTAPINHSIQSSGFISLSTDDVDENFLQELELESMYWRIDRKPQGLSSERVRRISGTIDSRIKDAIKSGQHDKILHMADWGHYHANLGGVFVRNDDYFFKSP